MTSPAPWMGQELPKRAALSERCNLELVHPAREVRWRELLGTEQWEA